MIAVMDRDQITAEVAARLVAGQFPQWAGLPATGARGGPRPGRHTWLRGGPRSAWDAPTRTCIDRLAADIDARAARQVWDSALASSWRQPPVWVHGDVTASNLLLAGGVLHAVIDFGCAAVGDPACDLVMTCTFLPAQVASTFPRGLHAAEATWPPARGSALGNGPT